MGLFDTFMGKIFGEDEAAPAPAAKAGDSASTETEGSSWVMPAAIAGGVLAAGAAAYMATRDDDEEEAAPAAAPAAAAAVTAAAPAVEAGPEPAPAPKEAAPAAPAPARDVDVTAMLDAKAKANSEKLDWKVSIVDLLKLIGMESSYSARKEMAIELGYPAADIKSKGSAAMNMWLHKQCIRAISLNGGRIPDDLLAD